LQEKWSIGLEWDLIEYVLDVYLMLVVGEGRHPVNVDAGSGHPGSTATTSAQGGNGGGMLGGNGALVPVHHHTARSDWPQQVSSTGNAVFQLISVDSLHVLSPGNAAVFCSCC
jgi:hypothetical protein